MSKDGTVYIDLTLREYFAAHAPESPPWFDYDHPGEPQPPEAPSTLDMAEMGMLNNARNRGTLPRYIESTQNGVGKLYAQQLIAYQDAVYKWSQEAEMMLLVKWRWAYADAMMKERQP